MDCKGILFDMDGTLVDSMGMWYHLGSMILKAEGKTAKEPDLDAKVCWMTVPEMKEFFEKEYGIQCRDFSAFTELYYREVDKCYASTIQAMPGIRKVLDAARAAGIRMCVATATRISSAKIVLERLGLLSYFEFVLSCDDVGAGKSHPDVYLKAAEKLGLPVSECVVFEDALVGIRTAKKAGFTVVAIRDPNAYWEAEEIRGLCDRYLTRYEDLLEG